MPKRYTHQVKTFRAWDTVVRELQEELAEALEAKNTKLAAQLMDAINLLRAIWADGH